MHNGFRKAHIKQMKSKAYLAHIIILLFVACSANGFAGSEATISPQLLLDKQLGPEISHPGQMHKRLNPLIGKWQMAIKLWGRANDKIPWEISGQMERRWTLDGRFIKEQSVEMAVKTVELIEFRGRRPYMQAGKAFRGEGYLGFDRLAGIYEHLWMHDDSTRMYYSTGRFDQRKSILELRGSWTDPYDSTVIFSRTLLTILDKDNHKIIRYISDEDTGEFKDLEILFTRSHKE